MTVTVAGEPAGGVGGGHEGAGARRIGRYQVEAVVGTGAFATVYRALDERLEDTVALKVLAENHSLEPEIRSRFLTEGRVLRRIDSPHVLDVYDLGETDTQQPFLVLEYANRGTLAQRVRDHLARGWRPAAADVWAVAEPLALALAAVHGSGVVHRDLNPGNVLLTTRGVPGDRRATSSLTWRDERLLLADLGLCKDLALNSGHTSAGGTEGFRPPELRNGPAIIDGRADLWSLSALLMWLVAGTPPGATPVEPAVLAAGLPAGLARALARGLAEDPAVRHAGALAWLADVAAGLGDASPAPAAPYPPGPLSIPAPGAGPGPVAFPGAGLSAGAGLGAGLGAAPDVSLPTFPARPSRPPIRLRRCLWLLAALPFGVTTWAGFLYIGVRARKRAWLWAAAAYGLGMIVMFTVSAMAPEDATGEADADSWQTAMAAIILMVVWFGGGVHALIVNRQWLRHPSDR